MKRVRYSQSVGFLLPLFVFASITVLSVVTSQAATLTVTNTLGNNSASSLRGRIAAASVNTIDTIVFDIPASDPGCVNNVCTITINSPILIEKSIIIQGNGVDRLVINGSNIAGLMRIGASTPAIDVSISGIKFTNGRGTNVERAGISYLGTGIFSISDCVVSDNNDTADISDGAGLFSQGGTLSVTNCRFSNNRTTSTGVSQTSHARGAAIYANSVTTIRNSVFAGNIATATREAAGGAIYALGEIVISDSTFSNNSATGLGAFGGGLAVSGDTKLERVKVTGNLASGVSSAGFGGGVANFSTDFMMTNSTVDDNEARGNSTAPHGGGGIYCRNIYSRAGFATIRNSTISNNRVRNNSTAAMTGGGILIEDSMAGTIAAVSNSTIAGNSTGTTNSSSGGGIYAAETIEVVNSTVAGNSSRTGGGIFSAGVGFTIKNTIVALNTANSSFDANGAFLSNGNNLIGRRDGSSGIINNTDITGTDGLPRDPGLETDGFGAPLLADNGGSTKTVALIAGSAAIDKGAAQSGIVTDQRGLDRPQDDPAIFPPNGGNNSDIGAFELDQCGGTVVTNTGNSGPGSLRCAISAAADGQTVTFDPAVFVTPRTITITAPLSVEKSVTISGPGANLVTVSTTSQIRIFSVGVLNPVIDATFNGITISGANSIITPQNPNPSGGGILYAGTGSLTISESAIRNCRTTTNNTTVDALGGGIAATSSGSLRLIRSTFSANQAVGSGGAEAFGGAVSVSIESDVSLENVTISGNSATTAGGGIHRVGIPSPNGRMRIISSTIVRNNAATAGGIVSNPVGATETQLGNTILALNGGNASTPDASGSIFSLGNNIFGTVTNNYLSNLVSTDRRGSLASPVDPDLGNLGSFGGSTQTVPLNATSPAIDRGSSFGLTVDQTGNARTIDDPSVTNNSVDPTDIGAVERTAPNSCTSNLGEGFWSAIPTWNCSRVPTINDDVVVRSGQTVIVDVDPRSASITIKPGGTLVLAGEFSFLSDIVIEDDGQLDVLGGKAFMNGRTVSLAANALITGTGGYVIGTIRKTFGGPTAQFVFPIGTTNGYSPVETANIPGPGTLTVSVTEGAHPSPGLGSGKLRRYWTVTNGSPGIVSADVSFNYQSIDIPATQNPNDYNIIRLTGLSPQAVAGTFDPFNPRFTVPGLAQFSDWTLGNIVPTAAGVSVSGRLTTSEGRGISGASVTLTDMNGVTSTARTGSFGFYRFDDVRSGEMYTVTVKSRRFEFSPPSRVISVGDSVTDIDFVANPEQLRGDGKQQ